MRPSTDPDADPGLSLVIKGKPAPTVHSSVASLLCYSLAPASEPTTALLPSKSTPVMPQLLSFEFPKPSTKTHTLELHHGIREARSLQGGRPNSVVARQTHAWPPGPERHRMAPWRPTSGDARG